jgi:hypothetical protein
MPSQARIKTIRKGNQLQKVDDSKGLRKALKQAEKLFVELLEKIDIKKIEVKDANDLYKISNSFAGLVRARTEYERWQAEKRGLLEEAVHELSQLVCAELENRPELAMQIRAIMQETAEKNEGKLLLE